MIKPEELEKLKANVVKFFGNGLIHEKVIAMHLVIGMADTRHSVSTEADTVMRRVQSGIDWNEKVKVDRKKIKPCSVKICIFSCHNHNFVCLCNLKFQTNSRRIQKEF